MNTREVLRTCRNEGVRFLRLQFTDLMGRNKNVEVPSSQFEKALEGQILFDGSSIDGFSRLEESDMLLHPDLSTLVVLPWEELPKWRVARLICDVRQPDGSRFDGCPRTCLKTALDEAGQLGLRVRIGVEIEFFLFHCKSDGKPTTMTHDSGGYFDLTPADRGELARQEIVETLEQMGVGVEGAHHEIAPGQHEIDLKDHDALILADRIATFKFVTRKVALDHRLYATFMPKPIFALSGSGMHVHQSLYRGQENAFYDPRAEGELSETARHYIAGLLAHARAYCAITNPIVNSFKRLVAGFEAPTYVSWSEQNRSPLVRLPSRRGDSTRYEVRMPDPSCNPYLALAVMLKAGLAGIESELQVPPPVRKNIVTMSIRDRRKHKIEPLPGNLKEALHWLSRDKVIQKSLGPHIYRQFRSAKEQEWNAYIGQVHSWELDNYLSY